MNEIENANRIYAWIIEMEEVVEYSTATSNDYSKGCPDRLKWLYDGKRYIGSGYICYYDIYGNLHCGSELNYFYK